VISGIERTTAIPVASHFRFTASTSLDEATHTALAHSRATSHRPGQAVADWHLVVEARARNGHEERETRMMGTNKKEEDREVLRECWAYWIAEKIRIS
jgi:hypothetical protein